MKEQDSSLLTKDAETADSPMTLEISGLDVRRGIDMTGGSPADYKKVLSLFRKDVETRLPLLQKPLERNDLPLAIKQVHALKSASASIGAAEISAEAARLEAAGRAGNFAIFQEYLPDFAERLTELVGAINAALTVWSEAAASADLPPDADYGSLLRDLAGALKARDAEAVERLLKELGQKPLNPKMREAVERISDQVLIAEFDAAAEIVTAL